MFMLHLVRWPVALVTDCGIEAGRKDEVLRGNRMDCRENGGADIVSKRCREGVAEKVPTRCWHTPLSVI